VEEGGSVINWTKIETEYVAGSMSLKELAKRKRVSYSTLSKRASEGGWAQKRKDFRANVENEALAQAQARARERMDQLLQGTEQLLDNAMAALQDELQFRRYVVIEGLGKGASKADEKVFQKYDTKAMKELTAMVKDLTGILRDAYGIRTPAQELGEKLALERIGQTRAQTGKLRAETARVKREMQREDEDRAAGNEITVRMVDGEEEFWE
jgi:hypothetical protein